MKPTTKKITNLIRQAINQVDDKAESSYTALAPKAMKEKVHAIMLRTIKGVFDNGVVKFDEVPLSR